MEIPDANGFVNITWPSKNVPHGGIFHTHVTNHSTEQQQFLKVLLEESKLDTKLRHEGMGLRREERAAREVTSSSARTPLVIMRPRTSRRRSLSAIRESGVLEVDNYRPMKKGEDREKLIEKLAYTMAFGDTPVQVVPKPPAGLQKKDSGKKVPTSKQKWNDLVTQIRERAEWLAEMEYLGEGDAHREIINQQIAERMRALDALGVDSQCSTARSTVSGCSTTRSCEKPLGKLASDRSSISNGGKYEEKKKRATKPTGRLPVEESVTAYSQLTPLAYSPRRRV